MNEEGISLQFASEDSKIGQVNLETIDLPPFLKTFFFDRIEGDRISLYENEISASLGEDRVRKLSRCLDLHP